MRVVFDTNVLVSALLINVSMPADAFRRARELGEILYSTATVLELEAVLNRPKFDRYVSSDERAAFIEAFIRECMLVEIAEEIQACRDPNDDKYLALALAGAATHIVSGDQDLLALHPFRGIAIVTPAAFLEDLGSGSSLESK